MTKLDKILKKIKLSEILNMKYMFWDGYIDEDLREQLREKGIIVTYTPGNNCLVTW